ncbi:MAG: nucleotidyltransferase family protein [Crocinitomix sp.]|nr:nucleotidyltransferase family protein [Crocinitomix sp.]
MNKPQTKEAIILAGGLGTRLRSEIGEFPKALAPINGIPFLQILLDYLASQGIEKVVLAVGYKWELIEEVFGPNYKGIALEYSIENTPLGTGGAIRLAVERIQGENCFIVNGDTLFTIDLVDLEKNHVDTTSACTLALKKMTNVSRYGSIELDEKNQILKFKEKENYPIALINVGIYCLNKTTLNDFALKEPFSFETDFMMKKVGQFKLTGLVFEDYFKDIGIPQDYHEFEQDLLNKTIKI